MEQSKIDWEDFKMSIDLHKFYLELIIKISFYYFAITGAILSFHFKDNSPDVSLYGLLLPLVLSILLGFFLLYGSKLAWNLKKNITKRAEKLNLENHPNGIILFLLCIIFGISMLSIGFALSIYLIK